MPIISVRQLRIVRDRTEILRGVDWTVHRGEHWVLLGANGSGKTSLLSALTGYLPPTDGDVTVLGHTFGESDWCELRCHVGLVGSALRQMIPDHEPARLVVAGGPHALIGTWHTPPPSELRRAQRALQRVGCADLARRAWGVLSQGERQRVLIARALMTRPQLLILDEPCAGLDPVAREQFLGLVENLARAKRGPALVLVTHHVEEITPAFSHALLLRNGAVFTSGKITDTLSSDSLTHVFAAPVKLQKKAGRYSLSSATGGW